MQGDTPIAKYVVIHILIVLVGATVNKLEGHFKSDQDGEEYGHFDITKVK